MSTISCRRCRYRLTKCFMYGIKRGRKERQGGRIFDAEIYLVILEHYVAVTLYPYPSHIYVKSIHFVLDSRLLNIVGCWGTMWWCPETIENETVSIHVV